VEGNKCVGNHSHPFDVRAKVLSGEITFDLRWCKPHLPRRWRFHDDRRLRTRRVVRACRHHLYGGTQAQNGYV